METLSSITATTEGSTVTVTTSKKVTVVVTRDHIDKGLEEIKKNLADLQ